MKVIIVIILILTSSISSQDISKISLERNNQGGFNLVRDGELIFVYNKYNYDSASLEILTKIIFEEKKEKSANLNVINLPNEEDSNSLQIILTGIAILGAIGNVFYTNWLNSKSQKDQYTRQIRAESKRQWLEQVRAKSSEYFQILDSFTYLLIKSDKYQKKQLNLNDEQNENMVKELEELKKNVSRAQLNFRFLFHRDHHTDFLTELENLETALNNSDHNSADDLSTNCLGKLQVLINDEQETLDSGNF